MNWNILLIPGVALGRAVFGWLENALQDGQVDLPEFKKLGETVIRMGVPMIALVYGLKIPMEVSLGLAVLLDIAIIKIYNAIKKPNKKKK